MKKTALFLCCMLVFAALPVMAFEKGDIEFSPSLKMTNADDLKTTDILLEGGYYFSEKHQGIVLIEYKKAKYGRFLDVTGGFFGLGYDYNFIDKSKNHMPFLGGGLKFPLSDYGDLYEKVLYAHGGFKSFFIPNKVAFRSSLDIEQYSGKGNIDNDMSISLRFGLVIFFKTSDLSKKTAKKSSGKSKKTAAKSTRSKKRRRR